MEADKSVDEKAPTSGSGKTALYGDKVWIHHGCERNDTRVEDERDDREAHIEIKEGDDFLAADSGVFGSDVEDHDGSHNQSGNVDKVGCYLMLVRIDEDQVPAWKMSVFASSTFRA